MEEKKTVEKTAEERVKLTSEDILRVRLGAEKVRRARLELELVQLQQRVLVSNLALSYARPGKVLAEVLDSELVFTEPDLVRRDVDLEESHADG
jgi:hypothetical protein